MLDSTGALYAWEWPHYPQWYVPAADVSADLIGTGRHEDLPTGTVEWLDLCTPAGVVEGAARRIVRAFDPRLEGSVRFEWRAADRWYEEDEQVFVHPRSPYVRVDALRSRRHVRVELDGRVLAESAAPVLVFETGLPTRSYLDATAVDFTHLVPTETVTQCPYKGTTSAYWSFSADGRTETDIAWTYAFPTRQLGPVAGLIAFYDERVNTYVDGVLRERPGRPPD